MNSVSRLTALLAPLRIYALGQNSLIDKELEAYGAGFALLEEQLARLEQDILPQTATPEGLDAHEAGVGLPKRDAPAEERRALILKRKRRPLPPPTPEGALELLKSAGLLEPEIYEGDGVLSLAAAGVAPGLDADVAWQLALESLPAHLAVETNPRGHDWDSLEQLKVTWNQLDALNKSWTLLAFTGITTS